MGRPPRYSAEQMLDVARSLVASGGAQTLTMTAVADRLGAPSGSVYHRFASRDHLAAELWLRTVERFQDEFIAELDAEGDPIEVAVSVARGVVEWAVAHPDDAVVLARFRRQELVSGDVPAQARRAKALARRLDDAFVRFAARLDRPVDLVTLAVAGLPYSVVRPALGVGRSVPSWAADGVERAVRALLC